ncbi:MAG: glycosyltransferase family 4 protein [Candidatus Aminicenantes bacterium]|nr:glycosyltransferase family 4 protein [Candidatus Aminicenantes bacterium]
MIIEQFLPAFHYGDATSNSALAFHKFLISNGMESRLITLTSDKKVRKEVTLFKDYKINPGSVKILHYAIPSLLTDFFRETGGKKVMIYHNITPSKYFIDYSEFLTKFTNDGRTHLESLKDSFDLSIGVSEYNADDLRKLDFKNVKVFPLIVDLKEYNEPFNKGYYNLINDDRKNILCVGRIAPNKKIEDAVKMLFFYKKYFSPSIRLIVAGNINSVPKYFSAVRDLASRFYLTAEDILFTGHIRFDEFLAVYKISNVYLSMSEHEGFCLPVMESFKMDLPVAAFDAGAIKEKVGDGGVIFDTKEPEKVAGILEFLINNGKAREKLIKSGNRRLDEYAEASDPSKLLELLGSI